MLEINQPSIEAAPLRNTARDPLAKPSPEPMKRVIG
jgi:hypothetical protein